MFLELAHMPLQSGQGPEWTDATGQAGRQQPRRGFSSSYGLAAAFLETGIENDAFTTSMLVDPVQSEPDVGASSMAAGLLDPQTYVWDSQPPLLHGPSDSSMLSLPQNSGLDLDVQQPSSSSASVAHHPGHLVEDISGQTCGRPALSEPDSLSSFMSLLDFPPNADNQDAQRLDWLHLEQVDDLDASLGLGMHPTNSTPAQPIDTPRVDSGSWQSSTAFMQSPVDSMSIGHPTDLQAQATLVRRPQRRVGVTCDHCRDAHVRCDMAARAPRSSSPYPTSSGANVTASCTRCLQKGLPCTLTPAKLSKRHLRYTRSGTVIEKARHLHGSVTPVQPQDVQDRANALVNAVSAATAFETSALRITDRVMARSLSLRLLNCYFAVCHVQMPVVDFVSFRETFNAANGDVGRMSACLPQAGSSRDATPGSIEALVAALIACATRYTDAPIAFDAPHSNLGLQEDGGWQQQQQQQQQSSSSGTATRRKRKRGVACDSCRLRRVRCDITERPAGASCTRCADKGINCTDEYIRSTRAKEKTPASKADAPVSETLLERFGAFADTSPSLTSQISPSAWIPAVGDAVESTEAPTILQRGKQRTAFCLACLDHALGLVSKHNLLSKPSIQSIQVLCLLSSLLEPLDPPRSQLFISTACSHIQQLELTTQLRVDQTSRSSVERLLGALQTHRIFFVPWCHDSLASLLLRRRPCFDEEWVIKLDSDLGQCTSPCLDPSSSSSSSTSVDSGGITQTMGVSYSIMAMLQLGSIARFIAKHIDPALGDANLAASAAPGAAQEMLAARAAKLTKACQAAWNSLDTLMRLFDRAASRVDMALHHMAALHPLGWVGTTKVCASLLHLVLARGVGERCASLATTPDVVDVETLAAVRGSLQALHGQAVQRAVESCRKTCYLIGAMLPKAILPFRGGLFRHLPHLAKFLTQIPTVSADAVEPDQLDPAISALLGAGQRQEDVLRNIVRFGNIQLGPWTKAAKQREVGWLVEALSQLGYAWHDMTDEAERVRSLLQSMAT